MPQQDLIDRQPSNSIFDLPTELFLDILSRLTKAELKVLRLVCSSFKEFANRLIFTTAYIATRREVFDVFRALSGRSELSQHVVEIIYDSSWLDPETADRYRRGDSEIDPKTSPESRVSYVKAFDEQERILERELASTARHAFKDFPHVRRLIYADFSRSPGFHWDRADDLGGAFRLGDTQWATNRAEELPKSWQVSSLTTNIFFRRRYLGLALLMEGLSQPDCLVDIDDLRIGDSAYSRAAGGIPDSLFRALLHKANGSSSTLRSLRELDLTISECDVTCPPEQTFPRFPRLELLRLVAPMCGPTEDRFAPLLRKPTIRLPEYCGEAHWPRLRALELKWIAFKTQDLLAFLGRHRDTLRFINLHEIYIHEGSMWGAVVSGVRSIYPNLIVEPYQLWQPYPSSSYDALVLDFTLYDDQATLSNTGIPIGWNHPLDEYDEDQVSSFSATEAFEDDERYSSEELDFSDDGDSWEFDDDLAREKPH